MKCPGENCNGKVKWDWCRDTYVVDLLPCIETECYDPTNELEIQLNIMQCPLCKIILSTGLSGNHGHYIFNTKILKDVDWETDENSV